MHFVEELSPPVQPTGDKKVYRLIKLPNGLKAILIRTVDNTVDNESLAALNVTIGVGSFDDPSNALGLAHYLEHMVHMGSKKYPEESGYNDFLSANGGKRNAMTGSQYTTYFFDVAERALPEAIDRLEKLLEEPLLLKNSMQREREAVDSEYQMKKSIDSVRLQSIFKLLIKESHPASQFDFGNLKSLKDDISDDDLHAELVKLHSKYVGNNMFVAIQSSKSLDEMQELIVKSFSGIRSGPEKQAKEAPANVEEFFKPDFFNRVFYIKPKTGKALVMTWPVPPILKHYKCSPMDYISAIFGNEGEGGIINYLREKHLTTNVAITMEEYSLSSNTDFALVRLGCDLTDLGTNNIEKILEAIFSYLLMIKESPAEEHRKLYGELKEKSERDFNFFTESKPIDNVMNYGTNFLVYDDIDVLRGNSVYQEYDEAVICSYIEALNKRKFNMIFLTDKHESFPKTEKYFGTEYDDVEFPESFKKLWDERKLNPEFYLEKPNPFKTDNFEIHVNPEESPKYPVSILENPRIKVWHKLDDKWNKPHVHIKMKLFTPIVKVSLENFTMLQVLENILITALRKKLSQATRAGYEVRTSSDRNGFFMSFEGFSDKIAMLIDIVTKFLPNCVAESTAVAFQTARENIKKALEEKLLTTYGLSAAFTSKVLIHNSFMSYDMFHLIDSISFEGVQKFADKFFEQFRIEVLAQGNVTKSQALNVAEILQANLVSKVSPEAFELKKQSYKLPVGSSFLRIKSLMPKDSNSFIKNFYQIGPDTLRTRNLARLIESILSPKSYDFLRSKEQLGYGVACKLDSVADVIGISLLVLSQENKNTFTTVYDKMNQFIDEVAAKTINELSEEDFETFKEARVKTLSMDHTKLADEANRNWAEIAEQDYIFNRFELSAKGTKDVTKSELQEFFKTFINPDNVRKLSIQVIGNSETDETKPGRVVEILKDKLSENEVVISNVSDFQAQLSLYPVVKVEID